MDGVPHRDDPTPASLTIRLVSYQQPMVDLVDRVEQVDIRHFETLSAAQARQELHPVAGQLVQEARALVGAILQRCESAMSERGGAGLEDSFAFERAIDAAVEAGDASIRAVEDVAFLVQMELRQRDERLRRLNDASDALAVIGECDSALRRIRKGLGAIDLAVARAEGLSARLDFSSELQESLLVREAYAKFRTRLVAQGMPAPSELYGKMRIAGTHIAVLVGWKAYPLLRVRDRLQLRDLQQRILTWLRPEHRADDVAGTRLWQDVVGFVEMLAQVNRRQELVKHDAKRVEELLSILRTGAPLDGPMASALRSLKGLDDELDAFIARNTADVPALHELLERIGARLGVPGGQS